MVSCRQSHTALVTANIIVKSWDSPNCVATFVDGVFGSSAITQSEAKRDASRVANHEVRGDVVCDSKSPSLSNKAAEQTDK